MSSLESKAKRFTSTEHSSAEYSYKSKVWFHKHGDAFTDVLFQTFIQQVNSTCADSFPFKYVYKKGVNGLKHSVLQKP